MIDTLLSIVQSVNRPNFTSAPPKFLKVSKEFFSLIKLNCAHKKPWPAVSPWLLTTHRKSISLLNQEMADEYGRDNLNGVKIHKIL